MRPLAALLLLTLGAVVASILGSTSAPLPERLVWAVMWCALAWLLGAMCQSEVAS